MTSQKKEVYLTGADGFDVTGQDIKPITFRVLAMTRLTDFLQRIGANMWSKDGQEELSTMTWHTEVSGNQANEDDMPHTHVIILQKSASDSQPAVARFNLAPLDS